MGRLTLNILLSFAQFEREIIGERTRDKMGAARRKGKYLGGRPLLGYDINRETKRLIVNEREAEQVRQIFGLYLEHEGLLPTVEAIRQTSKAIDALSTPTQDTARESLRVETLASLTDQLRRDEKRQRELETQIEAAAKATPDRSSILKAINDLESLWDHLSIAERSRLITLLIERIEHDPVESTISITLSPTGLNSFGSNSRETMQ